MSFETKVDGYLGGEQGCRSVGFGGDFGGGFGTAVKLLQEKDSANTY
jgi:hypothetical protein